MGWVTLSLRKLTLRAQSNDLELQDLVLSRQIRSIHRHLSYDTSVMNSDKTKQLKEAKEALVAKRKERPSVGSDDYDTWNEEYTKIKEEYDEKKVEIEDYFDDVLAELEEESKEEETRKQDEQTELEALLETVRQELESVNDQISSDIQSTKVNLK